MNDAQRRAMFARKNIEWNKIWNEKVIDRGSHFETENGDNIFWDSNHAAEAQKFLKDRSIKEIKQEKKIVTKEEFEKDLANGAKIKSIQTRGTITSMPE